MTDVEYINGYELFGLCRSSSSETLNFLEFRADLSDGFRHQALYGSSTGTRNWNFSFKTLTGGGYNPSIDLDGVAMASAIYLQDLFVRSKNSGLPFVVQSPVNDQYYLAEFSDSSLTLDRALVKLFSSGVNFRQVRLPNVSVFEPSAISQISDWAKTPITGATDNTTLPSSVWPNEVGTDLATGAATYQTSELGSHAIVRLDQSGAAQKIASTSTVFYEAYLLMKVREGTFSDNVGIISNNHATSGSPALLGQSGETKFFDLGFGSGYEYRKNGVLFAENNQQAPMNEFAVVHVRRTGGWTMADGVVFGVDRLGTFAGRKANIDIAEIIIASELLPFSVGLEVTEYLASKL